MAQKDKVKELVGRGLDSYHTKALQQIHRIEKKNKEQNHKINILTNELDNDYLTKTEEGSVISLEHSKEGMVYLDELQGNTLVNYCTDGVKELTLNGDIDVEGTFVTTTEGVDNGKVDVMCEGNTLVNAWTLIDENPYNPNISSNLTSKVTVDKNKTSCKITINENLSLVDGNKWIVFRAYPKQYCRDMIKLNTTYTLIFNLDYNYDLNSNIGVFIADNISNYFARDKSFMPKKGLNKVVITTVSEEPENRSGQHIYIAFPNCLATDMIGKYFKFSDFYMLEGDWTNKEIPSYFEGMKSVGQDDENCHKVEILSKNKNLLIPTRGGKHYCFIKKGTRLVLSEKNNTPSLGGNVKLSDINGNIQWFPINAGVTTPRYITTNNDIYCIENALVTSSDLEYQVEIGTERTSYVSYALNKKEILLNEPLRSLPVGDKDRFVKIGGKWFIERNIRQKLLTGADSENWLIHSDSDENVIEFRCNTGSPFITNNSGSTISDKFIGKSGGNIDRIAWAGDTVYITISRNKLATVDVAGFRQWLSNNNVLVQNQLATPTYEPLELEPILNTYNDVTHISNNSIIPCNMKIKNTGYNTIIKPSTLYTIALDSNKSGTIGINLGGAKITTTNNVATITTPATLTDDSLRLYGKGIKGSKVRLLEGDKTNWIPSFFEGMKSSFEDKLQEDGTFKMEILMNNKNLLDEENIVAHANITSNNGVMTTINFTNEYGWFRLKLKNTYKLKAGTYYLQFKMRSDGYKGFINEIRFEDIADIKYLRHSERLTNPNCNSDYQIYEFKFVARNDLDINYLFIQGNRTSSKNLQLKDFILSRIETVSYESNKSNKIQFSSIEPLRKWDRFVFKDGQLMIERGSKTVDLSSITWGGYEDKDKCYKFGIQMDSAKRATGNNANLICNSLPVRADETKSSTICIYSHANSMELRICIRKHELSSLDRNGLMEWLSKNPTEIVYELAEPTYEEIPFELQKIILEGYENGTLFFDTNIPPTSTVTYAGETPIVKATKLNKTEVLKNTDDINDNIVPYLMDMDYRVVCLQLEGGTENVSMARLFGGTFEMLQRDILSNRYSKEEYKYRLDAYLSANKITENEYEKLGDMLND